MATASPTVAASSPAASAAGWGHARQTAEFAAADGAANDNFASAVAVSADGSTAVVGAFGHAGTAGAAYVFHRAGKKWVQQAELTARDGASGDLFGASVAISANGSTVVVGAQGRDGGVGAAYVFHRAGKKWAQRAQLTAADGVAGDNFGNAVAISSDGSAIVVGAWLHDDGTGAAYVFDPAGKKWTQQAELAAADGVAGDNFGYAVAISSDGSTVVVGAVARDNATGAAYVFAPVGKKWAQDAELTASDRAFSDEFGIVLAISGNGSTIVVGALGHHRNAGAAYIFTRRKNGWAQSAEFEAPDGATWFATSVAVSANGSTVAIGAIGNSDFEGAAYVFTGHGKTWAQSAELTASDGAAGDRFGLALALTPDGSSVLVGASGQSDTGVAYEFRG